MAITVRFFAALREQVGRDTVEVRTPASGDIAGLLANIREQLGEQVVSKLTLPSVRIALNREFVSSDCAVRDGDEVAFMPPITGG
jgi:molybdopterin synthase sulfur carrier subunit